MEPFLKLAEELKFELSQDEIDDLLNKSQHVLKNIEMIENFNLEKYENLHLPHQTQFHLRDDEVVENDGPEIFQNAIAFEEGFVVVKSEK